MSPDTSTPSHTHSPSCPAAAKITTHLSSKRPSAFVAITPKMLEEYVGKCENRRTRKHELFPPPPLRQTKTQKQTAGTLASVSALTEVVLPEASAKPEPTPSASNNSESNGSATGNVYPAAAAAAADDASKHDDVFPIKDSASACEQDNTSPQPQTTVGLALAS